MSNVPELPYRLEYISTITGIRLAHLKRMIKGEMSPSREHRHELVKAIGSENVSAFTTHKKSMPASIEGHATRKVPNGYSLVEYMPAVEVIEGDLIAYRSALSAAHSSHGFGAVKWVKVVDVPGVVDVNQSTEDATWGTHGRVDNLVIGDEVQVVVVVEADDSGERLAMRIPSRAPMRVARRKGEPLVMSKAVYADVPRVEGQYLASKAESTLPYEGWTTELPS